MIEQNSLRLGSPVLRPASVEVLDGLEMNTAARIPLTLSCILVGIVCTLPHVEAAEGVALSAFDCTTAFQRIKRFRAFGTSWEKRKLLDEPVYDCVCGGVVLSFTPRSHHIAPGTGSAVS